MRVFIEQPGEKNKKNIFNKQTGALEKTVPFHLTYPYPYGYILDTCAADGDNLDCFVLTDKKFETGSIVECEPVGVLEQFEDGEADHNILTVLKGEEREVDDEVKKKLLDFDAHYFDEQPGKDCHAGDFLGKEAALEEIRRTYKRS